MRRTTILLLQAALCLSFSSVQAGMLPVEPNVTEVTRQLIRWYDAQKTDKPVYLSSQAEGEAFIDWLASWNTAVVDSFSTRLKKKEAPSPVLWNTYKETEQQLWRRFQVFKKNHEKYKIHITFNNDPVLVPVVKKVEAFFYEVYPMIHERYGKRGGNEGWEVYVRFDPELTNVPAYASDGKLTFSNEWFKKNPNDIGVLTHEAIHLLQKDYQRGVPGWLVEGMADYIRHTYKKIAHEAFPLPADTKTRNYTDAYRVTARFLNWMEVQSPGFNDYLHHRMMRERYNEAMIEEKMGMGLDALWQLYAAEQ
ncbi:basic secretory family protein [Parasegetibacter sp. NRK P23]|uniref:basic secretory family protein n=1 Tax=Parasegetibacter sp. NRK P23 TaxID=2942999 RepID=UPI00204363B1|nr:basic secretory family protein [Parasegetibacter sp. NRK P23]MCM5528632.1 basic secretory family protein [Parasegetibacter sp. NRK P23]